MKKISVLALSILSLSSSFAFADCSPSARGLNSELSKTLIAALKMTGNKGKSFHPGGTPATTLTTNYLQKSVRCVATNGGVFEDGLDLYSCETGPALAKKDQANAKVLFDAISAVGSWGDAGMSKVHQEVSNIRCALTTANGDQAPSYECSITAVWADSCNP
jgi:hypothetical protein